ncbi:MAG: pentapeptide repeat-containing protein [Pseudodesulfovibrio sp.]|nr:pentapeptide repeat-containing protein [Pseudodesulfovibrio sp.]
MGCCKCKEHEWSDPQPVVYTDPEYGKGYCLFHAPAEHKGVSVDAFNEQVSERIQATIDLENDGSPCCFDGTIFPGEICFYPDCAFPKISFRKVQFKGDALFRRSTFGSGTTFGASVFEGFANFSDVIFGDGADFFHAIFKRDTSFLRAIFEEGVSFYHVEFKGSAYFDLAKFKGHSFPQRIVSFFLYGANFCKVVFGDGVGFSEATFECRAVFSESVFRGKAKFYHTSFKEDAIFGNVSFEDHSSFVSACFVKMADFSGASFRSSISFGYANFESVAFFSSANFVESAYFNATFRGKVGFDSVKFSERAFFSSAVFNGSVTFDAMTTTESSLLEFDNCTISTSAIIFQCCDPTCLDLTQQYDLANIHFINSPWEKNGRIKACTEDQEDKLQFTRDLYQRMKAKYKAENNEYEASKWHVAEKEAQLKLLEQNGESWFLQKALWTYKKVSGFGENPVCAAWWLLFLLLTPLFVLSMGEVSQHFVLWNIDSTKVHAVIKDWLKFIPLTKASTLKDELGGWHLLAVGWQLLVTVQAALFGFALRNKFRR